MEKKILVFEGFLSNNTPIEVTSSSILNKYPIKKLAEAVSAYNLVNETKLDSYYDSITKDFETEQEAAEAINALGQKILDAGLTAKKSLEMRNIIYYFLKASTLFTESTLKKTAIKLATEYKKT